MSSRSIRPGSIPALSFSPFLFLVGVESEFNVIYSVETPLLTFILSLLHFKIS